MAFSTIQIVAIVYASFNAIVTIVVSIIGAKYTRAQFVAQQKAQSRKTTYVTVHQSEPQSNLNNGDDAENEGGFEEADDDGSLKTTEQPSSDVSDETELTLPQKISKMSFFVLWAKMAWKMRSVYMSLFVHAFDVLTDILVIISWWDYEKDEDIANIDARLMALCAIIVLLFHKIVSTAAFWIKEGNISRCLLQFLDFLIFEEIYISHKQIVSQFKGTKSSEAEAVDTSTSFKYIRSLEAVFESIPQSVLQMVFIIRTGGLKYNADEFQLFIISYLSIFQSIVSMTNSIIEKHKQKFEKHKQKLPPTLPFLKHMICRLSEVFYRIVLLSLFWSVCGGLAFGILLAVELFIIVLLTATEYSAGSFGVSVMTFDECLLRIQALVILPSEMVFAASGGEGNGTNQVMTDCGRQSEQTLQGKKFDKMAGFLGCLLGTCPTLCCFYFPAILLSTLCRFHNDHFIHPTLRIGVSMSEWTIIVLTHAITYDKVEDKNKNFLLDDERGLFLFIIGIVCFLIYSQYLSLLPKFILPLNASIRSKFGYAFNGELEELKRLNLSSFKSIKGKVMTIYHKEFKGHIREDVVSYLKELKVSTKSPYMPPNLAAVKVRRFNIRIEAETELSHEELREKVQERIGDDGIVIFSPADEEMKSQYGHAGLEASMAMFAFANGHYDIVDWLEKEHNARRHNILFEYMKEIETKTGFVRNFLDPDVNNGYFSK